MEYHGAIDFVLYRNSNNNTYTLFTADGTKYVYAGLRLSTIISPDSPVQQAHLLLQRQPRVHHPDTGRRGADGHLQLQLEQHARLHHVGVADLEVHVQGVRPLLGHRPAGQGHPVLLRVIQPVAHHRDSVPDRGGHVLHLRHRAGRAVRLDLRGLQPVRVQLGQRRTSSPGPTPTSSTWSTARWSRARSST